ncbi:MAG TPA: S8 family serine peptidase [Tepidisphaeraceae bacterium]|nr:S8 family serine peptidase [Tepidisphaeraceae bacterium]
MSNSNVAAAQGFTSGHTPLFENLESRRLLSSVPQGVLDAGFEPIQWRGETVYARPGQWLLQLKGVAGEPDAQVAKANGQLGRVNGALKAIRHLGRDGLFLLEAPKNLGHDKLMELFGGLGNFGYVEPDGALWTDDIATNDPYGSDLWGLNNTGQTGGTADADIDAPEAWQITRGDGSAVVGVIDTGVDYKHPDLAANMWVNPKELNGKRNFDDDGNGYKDDIHGYDFFNGDGNPMDDAGHGTHVAGTIAAAGNNGVGVVGVNWNAKVMALKIQGSNGSGPWSAAVEAVNYATKMKTQYGVNINVTNNSYGGWGYSEALYEAIKRNGEAGMMFVASAGNGGGNIDRGGAYPAAFDLPSILSVAATDHDDALANFSNYGTVNVDVAAPGVTILSTLPGNAYAAKNGTSMAARHVAGVAALAWSYAPEASYLQVRNAILTGVDPVESLSGKVFSGGRLNAYGALSRVNDPYVAPTAPAAPTELTAVASLYTRTDGSTVPIITLNWQPSAGPELQRYDVYRWTEGTEAGAFVHVATLPAGTTTFRQGLLAGTTYAYYVTAGNFLHTSAASNTAQATTDGQKVTIPDAPSSLTATAISNTQINLSWSDNSQNENGFNIERSTDGTNWSQIATLGANATTFANTNLKRNATYHYRVRAFNAAGDSAYSETASARTSSSSTTTLVAGESAGTSGFFDSIFSNEPVAPRTLAVAEAEEDAEDIESLAGLAMLLA